MRIIEDLYKKDTLQSQHQPSCLLSTIVGGNCLNRDGNFSNEVTAWLYLNWRKLVGHQSDLGLACHPLCTSNPQLLSRSGFQHVSQWTWLPPAGTRGLRSVKLTQLTETWFIFALYIAVQCRKCPHQGLAVVCPRGPYVCPLERHRGEKPVLQDQLLSHLLCLSAHLCDQILVEKPNLF